MGRSGPFPPDSRSSHPNRTRQKSHPTQPPTHNLITRREPCNVSSNTELPLARGSKVHTRPSDSERMGTAVHRPVVRFIVPLRAENVGQFNGKTYTEPVVVTCSPDRLTVLCKFDRACTSTRVEKASRAEPSRQKGLDKQKKTYVNLTRGSHLRLPDKYRVLFEPLRSGGHPDVAPLTSSP